MRIGRAAITDGGDYEYIMAWSALVSATRVLWGKEVFPQGGRRNERWSRNVRLEGWEEMIPEFSRLPDLLPWSKVDEGTACIVMSRMVQLDVVEGYSPVLNGSDF